MQKLRTFFRTFVKSVSSPEYYADVLKTKFSFSFKYFLFFSLLLSLIVSSIYSYKVVKFLPPVIKTVEEKINTFYPKDLIVEIKNGKLSTNKKEPVFFPLESNFNLVIIDIKADLKNLDNYKTAVLVTEDTIYIKDSGKGEIRMIPLKEIDSFKLDKNVFDNFASQIITPISQYSQPAILAAIFIFMPIGIIYGRLFYLLIASLFVLLLAKIMKISMNYGKAYQIGLHVQTLPTIVFYSVKTILNFQYFYSLLFFVSTFVVFLALKEKKASLQG